MDNSANHSPDLDYEEWENSPMRTVIEFIEGEMKERGLNPRTLAKASGMNYSTLHRVLHGEGEPRRKTLEPLAKFFKVSVDQMFTGEDQRKGSTKKRAEALYKELMTLPPDQRAALLARIAESLSR